MKEEKEKKEFCPECGSELYLVRQPNEDDYYTMSLYSIYGCNRAGNAYSTKTGKKLWRTVWECPTKKNVGSFFCPKKQTHYSRLNETDLE